MIVLGNGPSIDKDLEEIKILSKSSDFFCVNNFSCSDLYQKFKPNKYLFMDDYFFSNEAHEDWILKRNETFKNINNNINFNYVHVINDSIIPTRNIHHIYTGIHDKMQIYDFVGVIETMQVDKHYQSWWLCMTKEMFSSYVQKLYYYNLSHCPQNDLIYKNEVEYNKDAFLTWGNKVLRNKNFKPIIISSPLFSRILNKHNKKNNNIILVGTEIEKFNPFFWGWFIDNNESFSYRNSKLELINTLLTTFKNNFYYKEHHSNSLYTHHDDAIFFKNKFKTLFCSF